MMVRFDKAISLSLHFKSTLSGRLSSSLWESDVLLFSAFINKVSSMFLYTFLVIYFAQLKEYMIWQILLSKFSDALALPYALPDVLYLL